jgi:proline dehydrogenase
MIPPIANKFVVGEQPIEAINHAHTLNARGVGTILNLLGEHYAERVLADGDTATYRHLLSDIASADLDACISVKPSQIGLEISTSLFGENLANIVDTARETDTFVWVDMEDHTTTDDTLEAFATNVVDYPKMGLCVQANLRRSRADIERLADLPGKVRLVKGAYDPPAELAYRQKTEVDAAYHDLLELAFQQFESGVAVGSHDPAMIDHAANLHETHGTDYEVQMLTGVREDAQYELAQSVPVYQYAPYGTKWFSYFYRRVLERKENALFALRAVVGR